MDKAPGNEVNNDTMKPSEDWTEVSNIFERVEQSDFTSVFEFLKVYRYKQKKKRRLDIFKTGYRSNNTVVSQTIDGDEEKNIDTLTKSP